MHTWCVLVSVFCGASFVVGAPPEDLIKNLPGLQQQPNFKQYSGYLQASPKKFLHYWFVESQGDPGKDPLVLWMNGGPGCSSLDGLLTENGPFRNNPDGKTLSMNPYSWNLNANVLYLEAPAGVGFSYATDKDYKTDDNITALNNHAALVNFLQKFPEFADHDFYVTGESYAGIYIPTLLVLLKDDKRFKLKVSRATIAVMSVPINPYNIIGECYRGGSSESQRVAQFVSTMAKKMMYSFTDKEAIRGVSMMASQVEATVPCMNNTASTIYLNQANVREALHIKPGLPSWKVCSDRLKYTQLYDSMRPQFLDVLSSKKYRLLVYNGDMDMACNFLGDQMFVDNLKQKETVSHKPWYFNAADSTKQIGGWVRQFENLAFMTVRGAGHMVPTDRPIAALHMIQTFLGNHPF